MNNIIPVLLCGGNGTRLWPSSRAQMPKQFLTLMGSHSMFQQILQRVRHLAPPIVVCNQEHRFQVEKQLSEIDAEA